MVSNTEIQVIDDDMIMLSMNVSEKMLSRANLAEIVANVPNLSLSFKNIISIANLQGFFSLKRLCLDNNAIERIENLNHLNSLTWLDLSFNRITQISGLDGLEQLCDISLFNNRITEIEGLDSCQKLQCLSIGNNHISALNSIVKLRGFKCLKLLNLEGNPVSKEAEYRMYILAYLNDLTYLDYSMVTKIETIAAREQYQDELLDVEEKEALEQEKATREAAAVRHTSRLRSANLAIVETIFDEMFLEDTEMPKLKYLPGINDIINSFQSEVESASDLFLQAGLVKSRQKLNETSLFEVSIRNLRAKYASESISMIEAFIRKKKHKTKELASSNNIDFTDLEELSQFLVQLSRGLIDLETRQVEQAEDLLGEFEAKYCELKVSCLEGQQTFFRLIEEHENNYTRDLMQLINELLEKAAKGELPGGISNEASSLLMDRDMCMNAVTGSHDVHVGRLYKLEDEIKNAEDALSKNTIKKYRDEEHTRSRDRIVELKALEDTLAEEISKMIASEGSGDVDIDQE